MWRYTTFPYKAGPVMHYPSKDGHVLSGSVPVTNTKGLINFFARFEKPTGDGLVHFTLSLPAGRELSDEGWHEVARLVLEESASGNWMDRHYSGGMASCGTGAT